MKKKAHQISRLSFENNFIKNYGQPNEQKSYKCLFLFFILVFSCQSHFLFSATIYVKHDAVGSNDGSSWTDAYTDLQSALADAMSGDEIWVATGTYYPDEGPTQTNNNRDEYFSLIDGVTIYGGFEGTETNVAERTMAETTLSGDIQQDGIFTNNSKNVIYNTGIGSTAVIDGFKITLGYNFSSSTYGGGMYNSSASPTVTNCTFISNKAGRGGGMANVSSSPIVTNCTFEANYYNSSIGNTPQNGGGMHNDGGAPSISNCTFIDNVATGYGVGMFNTASSTTISNCTFTNNIIQSGSGFAGGGMDNAGVCNVTIQNCTFDGNQAKYGGGLNFQNGPTAEVTNCIFLNNDATLSRGGGVGIGANSTITLVNCIFLDNTANSAGGGGMFISSSLATEIINCSFTGNSTGSIWCNNANATVTNCILWNNNGTEITTNSGTPPTVTYSIVEGGFSGTGNSSDDPMFVSASDLHLSLNSAAYNAGDNAAVSGITNDYDGNPRISFGTVDMGVYESQTVLPVELNFFNGKIKENEIELLWQTASESNNLGFEIERSMDAKTWKSIGFVNGMGTSTEVNSYSFIDARPLSPENYYRLQQIDSDGTFKYSKILHFELYGEIELSVFPNPSSNLFNVVVPDGIQQGELLLTDIYGRQISSQILGEGNSSYQFERSGLPAGIYLLALYSKGLPTQVIRVVLE